MSASTCFPVNRTEHQACTLMQNCGAHVQPVCQLKVGRDKRGQRFFLKKEKKIPVGNQTQICSTIEGDTAPHSALKIWQAAQGSVEWGKPRMGDVKFQM